MEPGLYGRLPRELVAEYGRRGGKARAARYAALMNPELPVIDWPSNLNGSRDIADYINTHWTWQIVKSWEAALNVARKSARWDALIKVLVPMTAMCPALAPQAMRQAGSVEVQGLPSDADLSHLTDEQLAAIAGRPLSSSSAAPSPRRRRKRGRKAAESASPPGPSTPE
jgi:hypothetical protein